METKKFFLMKKFFESSNFKKNNSEFVILKQTPNFPYTQNPKKIKP